MGKSVLSTQAMRFAYLLYGKQRWDKECQTGNLTLDRIRTIFTADFRRRSIDFQVPFDLLADTSWIFLLRRIYADPAATHPR